ncbi:oxygenase MpaB family protein [Actinotalea sp. AC32]|nr:oxygenase MpaB family protein [Actinotalea sp. AC32]
MRLSRFFPDAPPPGRPGDPGLLGPGSAAWRVGRERALLLAGPAALLLQVSHPLVAAGVAAHSDFVDDPLRRLRGTLDAVLTVTFGDTEQVRAAAARVAGAHAPVRGRLPVRVGGVAAGTPYRAQDPALARWVLTTLEWSAVRATEVFVRPLGRDERDAYHRDMVVLGVALGVDAGDPTADRASVEELVTEHVTTTLAVDGTARALARDVLDPTPPVLPRGLRGLPALVAAGLLPPAVRTAYGLPWRRRERAAFTLLRLTVRAVLPLLPRPVRRWPHERVARRRVG